MQPTLLLSAPAVLSHKHSHSGARLTRDRARQANIIGKEMGDWEALTTPMSRRAWGFAQAGHDLAMGPVPDSLSAGPDNAGPGTSTACSAGRATPSRCTKHVILSTLPTFLPDGTPTPYPAFPFCSLPISSCLPLFLVSGSRGRHRGAPALRCLVPTVSCSFVSVT